MRKLFLLSAFGFMSMGAFAANGEAKPAFSNLEADTIKSSNETVDVETTVDVVRAEVIVNCEDGSSYTVSCDTCSTSQLIGIAMALCA